MATMKNDKMNEKRTGKTMKLKTLLNRKKHSSEDKFDEITMLRWQLEIAADYFRVLFQCYACARFKKIVKSGSKLHQRILDLIQDYIHAIGSHAFTSPEEMLMWFEKDIELLKQNREVSSWIESDEKRTYRDFGKLFLQYQKDGMTTTDVSDLFQVSRRTAIRWVQERPYAIKHGKKGKIKKLALTDVINWARGNQLKPYGIGDKCKVIVDAYDSFKSRNK